MVKAWKVAPGQSIGHDGSGAPYEADAVVYGAMVEGWETDRLEEAGVLVPIKIDLKSDEPAAPEGAVPIDESEAAVLDQHLRKAVRTPRGAKNAGDAE